MKHIVIISIGFVWGIIALAVTAVFGLPWSDASAVAPKFIAVAIVTSYAVMSSTEPRFQVLGLIEDRVWSAFITYRDPNIRIISVRRARDEERDLYYER